MGNRIRKALVPPPPPPSPPRPWPASEWEAREWLRTREYDSWKMFVRDLLVGYGGQVLDMEVKCEFVIVFDNDQTSVTCEHTLFVNNLIDCNATQYLWKQCIIFMSAPYRYEGQYLILYNHVDVCKFSRVLSINVIDE
jgi:hypothetical protein